MNGGVIRTQTSVDALLDVLDLDDRIVDENADHEGEPQQGHHVQAEPEHVHEEEGRNQRDRHRDGGDQRRAPIAQEDEHDERSQQHAFEQRVPRGDETGAGLIYARQDLGDRDAFMGRQQLRDGLIDAVLSGDLARIFDFADLKADDGLSVQQREGAYLRGAVTDVRDIGEPHRTPAAGRNRDVANLLDRGRGAENAQRLLPTAYGDAAARRIETRDRQRLVHVVGGQSLRGESIGIHHDVDLAIHAAHAPDLRNSGRGLQRAGNGVFDEPRQFRYRQCGSGYGVRDDWLVVDLETPDQRWIDIARQVGASLVGARAHVVEGLLQVCAQIELNHGRRGALRDRRRDVLHVRKARHRILDLPGDLAFHFGRRRAIARHNDRDAGELDVGEVLDR